MSPATTKETDCSLSYAVLDAVASHEGASMSDLPPLRDAINPDALDTLFARTLDGRARQMGEVRFEYSGYTIAIDTDGQVNVH